MPGGPERRLVEGPSGPNHDWGAQGNEQPLPAGKAQPWQEREGSRPLAERHEEQGRDQQPPPQVPHSPVIFGRVVGGALSGPGQLRPVPRRLNSLDQERDRDIREEGDGRPFRGVVHLGAHVIELVEAPLDFGRARSATHSSDRQLNLLKLGAPHFAVQCGHRRHPVAWVRAIGQCGCRLNAEAPGAVAHS